MATVDTTEELSLVEQTPQQVLIGGDSDALVKPQDSSGNFFKLVRRMRRHPTVSLARQLCVAPLLAADWSIDESDGAHPDAKQYLEKTILPLKFHLLKTSLYGCLDFGWQGYEKVGRVDEISKLIAIDKLKPLMQDYTTIVVVKETGAFNGFKQKDLVLALKDCLLVNIEVEGTSWYGEATSLNVVKPYEEWNNCNDAAVRYDKKLAGAHWVINYPIGKSLIDGVPTDNAEVARTILSSLQSSGCISIPRKLPNTTDDVSSESNDGWKIELLSAYPTSNVAFIERLRYCDALMARAYGLPERAVLEGQFGTKAEAEAHADFAITNMELRHQMMVLQYNWHLINQLLSINFGPEYENTCAIKVAPITDVKLQFMRDVYKEFLTQQSGFAVEQTSVDMEELRGIVGVPSLSEENKAAQATAQVTGAATTGTTKPTADQGIQAAYRFINSLQIVG